MLTFYRNLFFKNLQFFPRSVTVLHVRTLKLVVVAALQRHKFVRPQCPYS